MNETVPIIEKENEIKQAAASQTKELRAGRATVILLVFIAVQIMVVIAIDIVGVAGALSQGRNLKDPKQLADLTQILIPPAVTLAFIAGGIAMVLVSLLLVRGQLKHNSPTGAAWVLGSSKNTAQGLAIGLLIGAFSWFVVKMFEPGDHVAPGPIAQMAATPGLPQLLWIICALLIAPPVEELLFRGVIYGGYRRSFGPLWAAVLTTFIFVACHLTEAIYFLPSIAGITTFAIAALWLRLRSAAIGPSIAAHFGYNSVLAIAVTYSTL